MIFQITTTFSNQYLNPLILKILAYLESGPKKFSDLAKNLDISKEKIEQSLSYLTEHGIYKQNRKG